LFFSREDPTADWPPARAVPALDLERCALGEVRLGDPIEKARSLGKPRKVSGKLPKLALAYDTFELEFDETGLVCVSFDVDALSRIAVDRYELTRATQPIDAQVWFGDPASDSEADGLRWLDFPRGTATLALEFDEEGLDCVQLYAEGYA
jgi:hypothetical protein